MSEHAVSPVSSDTARRVEPNPVPNGAAAGKVRPDTGKISPPQPADKRAPNLNDIVQELNIRSRSIGRALRFQVDLESGDSVIHVIDRDTGELIRQVPPADVSVLAILRGNIEFQFIDRFV